MPRSRAPGHGVRSVRLVSAGVEPASSSAEHVAWPGLYPHLRGRTSALGATSAALGDHTPCPHRPLASQSAASSAILSGTACGPSNSLSRT